MENLRNNSSYNLDKLNIFTEYVICGAWAANNYQVPRNTQDLDLLVEEDNLDRITEEILHMGYHFDFDLYVPPKETISQIYGKRFLYSSDKLVKNTIIDVLTSPDEWVSDAIRDRQYDNRNNPIISIPYLTLMKIEGRAKDLADLTEILGLARGDVLEMTKKVIEKYLPNQIDDLATIVLLGKIQHGG